MLLPHPKHVVLGAVAAESPGVLSVVSSNDCRGARGKGQDPGSVGGGSAHELYLAHPGAVWPLGEVPHRVGHSRGPCLEATGPEAADGWRVGVRDLLRAAAAWGLS